MPVVIDTHAGPASGVCSLWTDEATVTGDNADLQAIDPATLDLAITWASDMLFDLSGRRWPGACVTTVRPLADHRCLSDATWPDPLHSFDTSAAVALGAFPGIGGWFGGGCAGIPEVDLGVYPLTEVTEVLLDGATLDPSAYRIDNDRLLTRVDGSGWPCWQDLTKAATQPNTWQVTANYGTAPPAGGHACATLLAREFALALIASSKCRLPSRTQQVTRQGVTIVAYPQSILDGGRVGLPEVDAWITSVNPKRIRARATVVSPDFPPGVRRAGT